MSSYVAVNPVGNPSSRFDEAWKEILDAYFQEFMEFFYPQLAENIDWSKGYEWMDKELQALTTDGLIGRRYVDKLVKIHSKTGQAGFVLLHTEVQGAKEEDFPERLYTYHYRLRDRYQLPILTLAILADEGKNWRPCQYQDKVWGETIVTFNFFVNKLLDYEGKEEELLKSKNPFGIVVAAQLMALRTQPNPQTRYDQKLYITRCLYKKGWGRDAILNLYYFIDAAMRLPEDLELQYNESIQALEEEKNVRYITSAERIGIEKGEQIGIEKGREEANKEARENLLKLLRATLKTQFSDVCPNSYASKIEAATMNELIAWQMDIALGQRPCGLLED